MFEVGRELPGGGPWQLLLHKVVLHPVPAEQTALMSPLELEVVLLEVVVLEDCHKHPIEDLAFDCRQTQSLDLSPGPVGLGNFMVYLSSSTKKRWTCAHAQRA